MTNVIIQIKRVYEHPEKTAKIDYWEKSVSPSTELQRWYDHDPNKGERFTKKHAEELDSNPESVTGLLSHCRATKIAILFTSRETTLNNAHALKRYLEDTHRL